MKIFYGDKLDTVSDFLRDNETTHVAVKFPLEQGINCLYFTPATAEELKASRHARLADTTHILTDTKYYFDYFSLDGLTYLLYRLGDDVDRKQMRRIAGNNERFVQNVNKARTEQVYKDIVDPNTRNMREDEILIAAFQRNPDVGSPKCVGLLSVYNPVYNLDLWQEIQQSGLPINHVTWQETSFDVYLTCHTPIKVSTQRELGWGLLVRNGETGLATLSRRVWVELDGFMFDFPFVARRRHMSRVNEVVGELSEILAELKSVDFEMKLRTVKLDQVTQAIPKKWIDHDRFGWEIIRFGDKPVGDFITWLNLRKYRLGYKTGSQAILKKLLEAVFAIDIS